MHGVVEPQGSNLLLSPVGEGLDDDCPDTNQQAHSVIKPLPMIAWGVACHTVACYQEGHQAEHIASRRFGGADLMSLINQTVMPSQELMCTEGAQLRGGSS